MVNELEKYNCVNQEFFGFFSYVHGDSPLTKIKMFMVNEI